MALPAPPTLPGNHTWRDPNGFHARLLRSLSDFALVLGCGREIHADPVNAAAMCSTLMAARPGWTVRRTWKARHASWPDHRPSSESGNVDLLNEQIAAAGVEAGQ